MIDTTEALDAVTVDAEAVFADIVTQLSDLQWNPDMTGPQAFGAMKQVLLLRIWLITTPPPSPVKWTDSGSPIAKPPGSENC